jgi:hypothetical protein
MNCEIDIEVLVILGDPSMSEKSWSTLTDRRDILVESCCNLGVPVHSADPDLIFAYVQCCNA